MDITIRPLQQQDLPEAERIFRLAFGTLFKIPDPMSFMGDADLTATRWRADPTAAFGAFIGNELTGSVFAAKWGSFGFFGPLTVHPDMWNKGIAKKLLITTMELFERWGTRQAALYTSPDSPKHLALYQKFGFWPHYLTPVMARHVEEPPSAVPWSKYSDIPLPRNSCLAACRALTHEIYPGLDIQREIQAVVEQGLGDTVLIHNGLHLMAFAICHLGKGSEAGSGTAYVKFGAVRPGPPAAHYFADLLTACEALARERGLDKLIAGVNTARHAAYQLMLERGFETFTVGVSMLRPNGHGYNRPDCFVIDDLR